MMLRHTMIVAAVAVGLVSCSASDEASTGDSQPPADTAPATDPTEAASTGEVPVEAEASDATVDDRAAAESALMTLGDYPEGWTEGPITDDDEAEFDLPGRVAECLGVPADEYPDFTDDESRAESGVFTSPQGAAVQQQAVVVDDVETATDAMTQYAREDSAACYREAVQEFFEAELETNDEFASALPADATIGAVGAESVEVPVSSDIAVQYALAVPIEFEGGGITLFTELLFFRQGRVLSEVQIRTTEIPFDPVDLGGLAGTVLARLEAVAG